MELVVGKIVEGTVSGITNFGAFIDLGEGKTGLVHISEVSNSFVKQIADFLKQGDKVQVKVLKVSDDGKISLSIKQAQPVSESPRRPAPSHGSRKVRSRLRICFPSLNSAARKRCLTSSATWMASAADRDSGEVQNDKKRLRIKVLNRFCLCDLPVNGLLACLSQNRVGFGKMAAAKKTVVSGKWTGMGGLQHKMVGIGNQLSFSLGISAP